jgi:hypothetical protein
VKWIKPKPRKSPEEFMPPAIGFVCEQDGPAERKLKDAFRHMFAAYPGVERAYLARVQYREYDVLHVALCVRQKQSDDPDLRRAVGEVFAHIFSDSNHLDIITVSEAHEESLRQVCRPFYERPEPDPDAQKRLDL